MSESRKLTPELGYLSLCLGGVAGRGGGGGGRGGGGRGGVGRWFSLRSRGIKALQVGAGFFFSLFAVLVLVVHLDSECLRVVGFVLDQRG